MKRATILRNGKVVRTENFDQLLFVSNGHLQSFRVIQTNIVYSFFTKHKNLPAGYYEKEKYQLYKSADIIESNTNLFEYNQWENAIYGDEIIIHKITVNYVGQQLMSDNYICVREYKAIFNSNHLFYENDINITGFTNSLSWCSNGLSTFSSYSIDFFEYHIKKSNLDDQEFINIIKNITLLINKIDTNIYTAFNSPHIGNDLIHPPNNFLDFLGVLGYEKQKQSYKNYYESLNNYYNTVTNYLKLIQNGDDMFKTVAIAASIHPVLLVNLSLDLKIKIINFIANEFYIKDEITDYRKRHANEDVLIEYKQENKKAYIFKRTIQELVANLTYSFTLANAQPNPNNPNNESDIDVFLAEFLKIHKDGIFNEEEITLYEVIYKILNQAFNITEGLVSLSNAIFNADFKPNNTKSAFVNGLYTLWQFSKYNPFHYDTLALKSFKIGFKILDQTKVNFNNSLDAANVNCLYQYTHEIGYYSFDYTGYKLYRQKFNDASPIVLPYESTRLFGFFDDNFDFIFSGKKIKAIQNKLTDINESHPTHELLTYGIYDLYQPVTVVNTNIDTRTPFITTTTNETELGENTINSLIPIFVLKHIDDAGDQSDTENMIGFLVDGLLTFSFVGNLAKLRHLRWAVHGSVAGESIALFSKQGFSVVLNGVAFSAGVVSFFANFYLIDCLPPTVPENSTDPAHILAWENYRFCQSMRTFIVVFQLATLTVTVGDSLTTIAMQKQAARIIDAAGGGTSHSIIKTNVQNKLDEILPNNSNVDEAAEVITNTGKTKYLNAAADLLIEVDKIYDKIHPKILERIIRSDGAFKKSFFNQHFNSNNLKIIIQDCLENGISDQKVISDIVITSCRKDILKQLTFIETRIVINYYGKVIRKRGFPTGFHNLADYKLFSQKVKSFLDDYCNTWGIKNAKYEIQGSVQFKSSTLDPNVNDVPVLTKNGNIVAPDDLDGRILISQHQANKFLKEMKGYWRKEFRLENPSMKSKQIEQLVNEKMNPIIKKANKDGIIHKGDMPPPTYKDDLLNAVKRDDGTHIFYLKNSKTPPETEIGFAIVIQRTNFDIQPAMSLKF
jgi:hypothetical protein